MTLLKLRKAEALSHTVLMTLKFVLVQNRAVQCHRAPKVTDFAPKLAKVGAKLVPSWSEVDPSWPELVPD